MLPNVIALKSPFTLPFFTVLLPQIPDLFKVLV